MEDPSTYRSDQAPFLWASAFKGGGVAFVKPCVHDPGTGPHTPGHMCDLE